MGSEKWNKGRGVCLQGGGRSQGSPSLLQVLFLPTNLEKAEQTFIIVCDNCQIKELVTVGRLVCAPRPGLGWTGAMTPETATLALSMAQLCPPYLRGVP